MPASAPDMDDDAAIARLLAEDAKSSSFRYASQGLSALLPRRQTGSAPKPNTRFLKALVRDADSHNAALRRKEDRERVERLRNGGHRAPDHSKPQSRRLENRGDTDTKDGRERKRRRLSEDRTTTKDEDQRLRKGKSKHGRTSGSERHARDRSRSASEDTDDGRHRRNRRADSDRETRHSRGSEGDNERERSHRKHRRRRSRSPNSGRDKRRHEAEEASNPREKQHRRRASSSDPLEDLVGPLPAKSCDQPTAVRVRGRGAHKLASASNIDSHFSSNYDPSLDVHPDNETPGEREDWDMALEALRDRQAWKKKHADRLREAGFGDEEIEKWEDSGREKDARDVRWRARGQVREWDVGKDQRDSEEEEEGREGRLTP